MNDNVNERLARLERENRRMKMAGVLMLALFAGVFLLGQAPRHSSSDIVTARQFTMVDEDGKLRATLGMSESGVAGGLWLYDESENVRANFYSLLDGTVGLSLFDNHGNPRASLDMDADGASSLVLSDKDGKPIWTAP